MTKTSEVLRNSSARSAKIIGAAAIALLAACNTFANTAENPAAVTREQNVCAAVLGLDQWDRRYGHCTRSLERSLSEWNYSRLVSTNRSACAQDGLQPGTQAFAVCVVNTKQSPSAADLQPQPATLAASVVQNADAAESANKSARAQDSLACADLGIDPGSPIFSQCVADLHDSLWAAKNQNLAN